MAFKFILANRGEGTGEMVLAFMVVVPDGACRGMVGPAPIRLYAYVPLVGRNNYNM